MNCYDEEMPRGALMKCHPIAAALREARLSSGFQTVSEAARAMGVPVPSAISHEGTGKSFHKPKLEYLQLYAKTYGVSLESLVGPAKAPSPRRVPMKPAQLEDWMARHSFSQAELARQLEVSRQTLAAYLTGTQEIPLIFELAVKQLKN